MNNNINEQNNQGMNNTIPTNASETLGNNSVQPINQQFMNNNMNQPTNQQFMNNNMNQPTNQQFMNNNFDGGNNLNQNNFSNMATPNYLPNNNSKINNKTKKIIIISAIILVAVGVILFVISLLAKSPNTSVPNSSETSKTPSAKKTLTCTVNVAAFGVYYNQTYEYYINDSSVSVKTIEKIDLKKTKVEGDEGEWAKQKTDSMSAECNSTSGCKFDYKYSKGNYLETIVFYGEEMTSGEVQGLTAEEIYNKQKARHEGGKVDGLIYTCSGDGEETTDLNNQSVYKTIDFNSYTGDSNSTDFDLFINKKVTFTNVPAFGGDLGTLNKNIWCKNESSLTIEDDLEYTVTGIVSHNTGTYSITLKDCTITKN